MLTALYEYALSRGLLEDTNYEKRRIDLILDLDADGKYRGIIPTPEGGLELRVPRQSTRASGIAPGFVVDNAKYVFGLMKPGSTDSELKRTKACNEAYAKLIFSSLETQSSPALRAIATFQTNIESNLVQLLKDRAQSEWTGSENVATQVDGAWAHDEPDVKAAWARMRSGATSTLQPARCLVTGEMSPPEKIHPPIKRLPGTPQAQTMLVSFNADAFTSMNFEQAQNAPVSRRGAEGYVTALNALMSEDRSRGRRFSSGIGLGTDSVMLVWTRDKTPELNSLLDLLDSHDAESGLQVVGAPMAGLEPSSADRSEFFAVTLSGNAARVVVRDWYQTRFGEVKQAVRNWFNDLRISGEERPFALWQLLSSLDPPGSALPPSLGAALARAAIFGGSVPIEILRHSLVRFRIPPKPKERHLLQQRAALIKLVLIRTFKQEISMALDEAKTNVPYLLGRLFAVLERLQSSALGDINATIRDRYFGAASSTPSVVFPRLLRLSVHHASKSGAGWLEGLKGRVVSQLPAEGFPHLLSLEDQGLFAVGYYHQREKFFEKREPKETNANKEDT